MVKDGESLAIFKKHLNITKANKKMMEMHSFSRTKMVVIVKTMLNKIIKLCRRRKEENIGLINKQYRRNFREC